MNDLTRLIDAGAKIGVPDRTGFDQIDVAAKKLFQGLGQTEKLAHGAKAATRLEIDKEVGVATHGVEVSVTRGRVKYLQTPHRVTAAQSGDFAAVLLDQRVHDGPGHPGEAVRAPDKEASGTPRMPNEYLRGSQGRPRRQQWNHGTSGAAAG